MKISSVLIPVHTRYLVAAIFLSLTTSVLAVPFHTPTIDGTISGNGVDWDPADLVINDIHDDDLSRTANVRRLWFTWDQDSLYVAVTYQDFVADEALSVYLDLDRGVGPNDASVLDNNAGNFLMPAGHRIELVLGRDAADGADLFEGPPPLPRLVTSDNGTTISLAAQANAKQKLNTGTAPSGEDKARFPFWANSEIALPWSAIYPNHGGGVPAHAVIKAVAIAAIASLDSNGYDSAPDNDGMNDDLSAQILLANLSPSVIDANGDGQPDPADATISGTVTLPLDPGTGAVTVQAELIEFAGRDPGAPLSVVTTPDGVRTWTLPRLPTGRYRITTRAVGYFSDEIIIDVAQSQAVTGQDQTLDNATTISGTVSFASGPGALGSIELRDNAGLVLDSLSLTVAGGSFAFFVETSGDYVVAVKADTYLDAEWQVAVTVGTDVTNVDIIMVRQTDISGSVTFTEGDGQPGTLLFSNETGEILASTDFSSYDGTFQFFTPVGGNFTLSATTFPPHYYAPFDTTFAVTAGVDITDMVLALILDTVSGISDPGVTIRPVLLDAHPNPFNPQTTIAFDVPSLTAVKLTVYDVSGRLVDVLLDGDIVAPGRNEVVWRGRDMAGQVVSAGVYFYRLEVGNFIETKRMTLVK